MKSIFQRMRALAPMLLLVNVLFIILTYVCMSFDVETYLPGWLYTVWYALLFISVYLAMLFFVVIIIGFLIKLKANRE